MSLYAEHGSDYKQYGWSEAWSLYKENFRPANQVFYTFFWLKPFLFMVCIWWFNCPTCPYFRFYLIGQFDFLIGGSPDLCSLPQASSPFWVVLSQQLEVELYWCFSWYSCSDEVSLGDLSSRSCYPFRSGFIFFVLLGLWHFFVNDIFQPVYETIRSKVVS